MMALSGVRSSWLTVARKRALDSSASCGVAAGALELLRPALVVGDVAGHRDDGVLARCAGLGVDPVGAGLDPDHPGRVPVLPPLGRFEHGGRNVEGDRLVARAASLIALRKAGTVGDVHAARSPRPTRQAGGTPRSFVAAALA